MFIFFLFIFGVVLQAEPLDYDSAESLQESYVAQSPELHDPKFSSVVNDIMGTNQESSDMLKDAVKETFGDKDPVEAMKEINPKVPQHIEDPALAEALLGHFGQDMHSQQSIGDDDDDDTDFFSQSSDESLLADVSERKEESKKSESALNADGLPLIPAASAGTSTTKSAFREHGKDEAATAGTTTKAALTLAELKKAGAKIEEGSPSNEKTVGEDMTPRGFILSDEASVSSHSASLTQSSELQVWGLAVFFGVLIPMTLIALCSRKEYEVEVYDGHLI